VHKKSTGLSEKQQRTDVTNLVCILVPVDSLARDQLLRDRVEQIDHIQVVDLRRAGAVDVAQLALERGRVRCEVAHPRHPGPEREHGRLVIGVHQVARASKPGYEGPDAVEA